MQCCSACRLLSAADFGIWVLSDCKICRDVKRVLALRETGAASRKADETYQWPFRRILPLRWWHLCVSARDGLLQNVYPETKPWRCTAKQRSRFCQPELKVCLRSWSWLSFAIGARFSSKAVMIGFRRSESKIATASKREPKEARGRFSFFCILFGSLACCRPQSK